MGQDPVVWLGFLNGSALENKVLTWNDRGGARDGDVVIFIFTRFNSPLKRLVSDRKSSLSESDILPPAQGRVRHREGEW